jgi:hypothetical protein
VWCAGTDRGQAVHHLLESGTQSDDPYALADVLTELWPVELDPPARPGKPWTTRLSASEWRLRAVATHGTSTDAAIVAPLNRSRSTAPLIPGTEPVLECCQNVQPLPPQLPAGTAGAFADVQCAIQSG